MSDSNQPEFCGFPKMARLFRDVVIQEKIDGTNAQVLITEDGGVLAGSRTRWITPEQDNFGFARWVQEHQSELLTLGPGRHFGEWMGQGIQRNYGLKEKRWYLFNTIRWCLYGQEPQRIPTGDPRIEQYQDVLPPCCHLVPVLYRGPFSTIEVQSALYDLETQGSVAVPTFDKPEGIVVFHTAANIGFKVTLENDGIPKSQAKGYCKP